MSMLVTSGRGAEGSSDADRLRGSAVPIFYSLADGDHYARAVARTAENSSDRGASVIDAAAHLLQAYPDRDERWFESLKSIVAAAPAVMIILDRHYSSFRGAGREPSSARSRRSSCEIAFTEAKSRGTPMLCLVERGALRTDDRAQREFIGDVRSQCTELDTRTPDVGPGAYWMEFDRGGQRDYLGSSLALLRRWAGGSAGQPDGAARPSSVERPPGLEEAGGGAAGAPRTLRAISTRMLSDAPVGQEEDLLGFGVYADALSSLIDNPQTSTPLTFAINAPWGAGKSSLARMVANRLRDKPAAGGDRPHVVCEFNAWMHDDADNPGGALVATVAKAADAGRPTWRRWLTPLPHALRSPGERQRLRERRRAWLIVITAVLSLGVLMAFGVPKPPAVVAGGGATTKPNEGPVGPFLLLLGSAGAVLAGVWVAVERTWRVASAVASFVQDPAREAATGSIGAVRDQLGELIRRGTPEGSRFVIFVDDLERCRPPKAMDVLEAVNQLLGHEQVVTVLIADVDALAVNAEIKYESLAKRYAPAVAPAGGGDGSPSPTGEPFGRLYLQKFIQLQFDLPPQSVDAIAEFARDLSMPRPKRDELATPVGGRTKFRWRRAAGAMFAFAWTDEPHPIRKAFARRYYPVGVFVRLAMLPLTPIWWLALAGVRKAYPLRGRVVSGASRARSFWNFAALLPLAKMIVWAVVISLLWWRGVDTSDAFRAFARLAFAACKPEVDWLDAIFTGTSGNFVYDFLLLSVSALVLWALAAFLCFYMAGLAQFRRDATTLDAIRRHLREDFRSRDAAGEGEVPPARSEPPAPELSPAAARLIRDEQERLYVQNESGLFADARDEVVRLLPPMPRHVKRVLNRLRLVLLVAYQRGLFGDARLDGRCIGKWIAWQERWPELAVLIARNAELLEDIEAKALAGSAATFADHLRSVAPKGVRVDGPLHEFVRKEPRLKGLIERIILFRPPPATTTGAATVADGESKS